MKLLKQVFDFYLNSSTHVALNVCALTWITFFEYDLKCDNDFLFFIFFATITGYNFVKYFGIARFHHRSLATSLRVIQLFSLIAFVMMLYFTLRLNVLTIVIVFLLGLITFFYAVPIIPKNYIVDEHQNLRQIGGIKVYVIALVWTASTVFLPLIEYEITINFDVIVTALQRFLFVIVLMIPFEIRDLNYDSLKLATLPQKTGVKGAKGIGALLIVLFFLLQYFKDEISATSVLSTLLIMLITLMFLIFTKKTNSKYYTSFWVEGLPIIWLGILLMLS